MRQFMSAIPPSHSILNHLPAAVRDIVCTEEYQILSEKPDSSYGHLDLITIYPSLDKEEAIIRISYVNKERNKGVVEYAFKDQKCTHDTYRIYTKGHLPLSAEKVNEIYLTCLKQSLANRNGGSSQMLLGSIINELVRTRIIKQSEVDMPLIKNSIWEN